MHSVIQAALSSWSVPWVATVGLILTALVYLRGWYLLRCAGSPLTPPWRVASFLSGLLALWIALASPMDVFNGWLLTAHMLQHIVLMMIAPSLILLGAPLIPLLRGLPVFAAREFAGPFLNWMPARRLGRALTQPAFALVLMGVVMLGWHVPALYELALRSPGWHQFEHLCFVVVSLIFWWPVIEPWPSTMHWPRWAMVPYLVIADLQNTILSATLVFADRVLYPSYIKAPRVFGLTAHEDQAATGAIMWVLGSLAFLVPAILIAVQCLVRRQSMIARRLPKRRPILAGTWQSITRGLGMSRRTAEALSFVALFVAMGLAFSAALALPEADDDDLVLWATQQAGDIGVWVYTPDGDLAVGENRVAVLVLWAGAEVVDSSMELSAWAAERGSQQNTAALAEHADSRNKLLRTAVLGLPRSGDWLLHLKLKSAEGTAILTFRAEVDVRGPKKYEWWPQLIFPAMGLCLLLVYWRRRVTGPGRTQGAELPLLVSRAQQQRPAE